MNAPLVEHPLRPVLRSFAKRAGDRAGGDLHPYTTLRQPLDRVIAHGNPSQALGVGENRYVPGSQNIEEEILDVRRLGVMRRLD
jgi:hypothetical protein